MRFFPSIYIAAGAQPSVFHGWFVPSEAVAVFKKKKNKIKLEHLKMHYVKAHHLSLLLVQLLTMN